MILMRQPQRSPWRKARRPGIEVLERRELLDAGGGLGDYPLTNPSSSNSLLVRFHAGWPAAIQDTLNSLSAYIAGMKPDGTDVVVLGQGLSPAAALGQLQNNPQVQSVAFNGAGTGNGAGSVNPLTASQDAYGVGLTANTYYSSDAAWVDIRNLFNSWGDPSKPWSPDPSIPRTADGYPLVPAATVTSLIGYPKGNYTLSYTGTATITFSGMNASMGPVITTNGVSTATVSIDPTAGKLLIMYVSGLDPNNPLDNLHLIAPGYSTTNPPIFTTTFLQRLQPFATIRFKGWMVSDNSPVQNWSDVPTANDFVQTGPAGPSYQDIVDLANTLNKSIWINIPDQATTDFIKQLADFLVANLNPNINVYVELSNELWNPIYPQYQRNLTLALANPNLTATGDFARAAQEAAYRLMVIGQTFDQEFGSQASRVQMVFGAQAENGAWASAGLSYIASAYGSPSNYFTAIAIAPYVRMDPSIDVPGLTLNQLFASMNNYLNTTLASGLAANASVAQQYGVQMFAYEGGQSLLPRNSKGQVVNYSLKLQAQNDPRMGQLYRALDTLWRQDGGTLFDYSALTFAPGDSGFWGLLNTEANPGSMKWDTVMSMMLSAGDADLDGIVDYNDFRILEKNYGKSGRWWQQGDFNQDGTVGTDDFQALWNNLDTAVLTTAQYNAIVAFGQQIGVL
jgi:hypothetical protein